MAHRPRPTAPPRKRKRGKNATRPTDVTLKRLYCEEGLTQRQIAEQLGASTSTVVRWIREAGIETRQGRNSHQAQPEPEPEQTDELSEDRPHPGAAYRNKHQWVDAHMRRFGEYLARRRMFDEL